jgi:hypothetical protein
VNAWPIRLASRDAIPRTPRGLGLGPSGFFSGDSGGFRGVLAKRAVVYPKGEPAHLGAGSTVSSDADFESEYGVCG